MAALTSGLAEEIDDSEHVGRFITSSGHVAKTKGRVKHPAFFPDKTDDETSIFRVDGLDQRQISEIGSANIPYGNFHGAAVLRAGIVRRETLTVLADEPPDRHGVFRSWPHHDDAEFQKARRMEIAMALAEEANFVPRIIEG